MYRALFLVFVGAVPASLLAQPVCFDCPQGQRVSLTPSGQFQPDPAGQYRFIPNEPNASSSAYAFSVTAHNPSNGTTVKKRVPMSDPTILFLDGWYYLTGTSDAASAYVGIPTEVSNANFAIYKSRDLVEWQPHMIALWDDVFSPPGATNGFGNSSNTGSIWTRIMLGGSGASYASEGFQTVPGAPGVWRRRGRSFRFVSGPQLFVDPSEPTRVYLLFNAVEGPDDMDCSAQHSMRRHPTIFVTSMLRAQFTAVDPNSPSLHPSAGYWFTGESCEPLNLGYAVNNIVATGSNPMCSTTKTYDAGCAQSIAQGLDECNRAIPVSPLAAQVSQPCLNVCGYPFLNELGAYLNCKGAAPWMAIDPFVFIDYASQATGSFTHDLCSGGITLPNLRPPGQDFRRWMLYSWFGEFTQDSFYGTHITAAPMIRPWLMDAYGVNQTYGSMITLAYRSNNTTSNIPGSVPAGWQCAGTPMLDGVVGPGGYPWEFDRRMGSTCTDQWYGVAEGPAAFARLDRTYVLYSRNHYDGPAYDIVYRQALSATNGTQEGLLGMRLCSNAPTVSERMLVRSVDRLACKGRSFGHGEVIEAPTLPAEIRHVLVFGAKEAASTCDFTPDPYPHHFSGRTVYFKNLLFNDSTGEILHAPIADWSGSDSAHADASNVRGFLVPACDSIDFNNDGQFPDTTDIDDFLSVFTGGPCSTGDCNDIDFNNDGLLPDTLDVDSFLSVFTGGLCL